jgi:hypothetical protein
MYESGRMMEKKPPDEIINEAKKLRMEDLSLREIAAKLGVKRHTSLQLYLKGIPKGAKRGQADIQVPVPAEGPAVPDKGRAICPRSMRRLEDCAADDGR